MDNTLVFQEVFSMIANLIGPTKWIFLAKELKVYPEDEFDREINDLNTKFKKAPERVWTCLTAWRLGTGKHARVSDLLDALRSVRIYWLADKIIRHLEDTGALQASTKEKSDLPEIAVQSPSAQFSSERYTKFDVSSNHNLQNTTNNNSKESEQ